MQGLYLGSYWLYNLDFVDAVAAQSAIGAKSKLLKRVLCKGLERGPLSGLLKEILGVETLSLQP